MRLATRFRLVLALGTALTILYFACTLTGKSTLWDLLGFLPLFLAPAVAYTWNWWTAKAYEIPASADFTLGPTAREPMPTYIAWMLILSATLPLVSVGISIHFAENHRPSVVFIAIMTAYWALKHVMRAYALASHSRPFEARSLEIVRLSAYACQAGLGATIFLIADTIVPFRQNPFAYLIGMGLCAVLVLYFDRRLPPANVPPEPTPSDSWKAGYLYFNPRDPAWIVPRPDASSYAANLGHASALLLVFPEALASTAWISHFLSL